jgi:hypothetical protein
VSTMTRAATVHEIGDGSTKALDKAALLAAAWRGAPEAAGGSFLPSLLERRQAGRSGVVRGADGGPI